MEAVSYLSSSAIDEEAYYELTHSSDYQELMGTEDRYHAEREAS
jgi:hypothetical protein